MRDERAAILVLTAKFLDYPDQGLLREWDEVEHMLNTYISSDERRSEMLKRLKPLLSFDHVIALQELYVDTFDYKEKTGLYLTAQELGDSRRRGQALIQMQRLIADLGFERVDNELADYIPMLLELLAAAPEDEVVSQLHRRLAFALHRIHTHLPESNPYCQVLDILMTYVFEAPNVEEIARLENEREEADLDPLPYLMLYQ